LQSGTWTSDPPTRMHAEDVGVVGGGGVEVVVVLAVFSSLVDCRAAPPVNEEADSGDVGEWTSTMWPLYSGRRPVRWAKEMAMAGLSMERLCVWSVWGGRRGGVRH